ncbi:unnamed protein product [Spodoptera exigua]|nr:unnamed protein product [Spodoptera exigua]
MKLTDYLMVGNVLLTPPLRVSMGGADCLPSDEEIDELPFMASLGPVLTILAVYLVFVLKIGPVFMRKREGYKLTYTLLIYNAIQVAFSVYMVYRFLLDLLNMGLVPKKCYMNEDSSRNRIQFVSIIIQYVATVRVSECPPARGVAIFVSCNTGVILLLFLNFYRQSYNKKRAGIISNVSLPSLCLQKEE